MKLKLILLIPDWVIYRLPMKWRYKMADIIRDDFLSRGYVVRNKKGGSVLKRRLTPDM